MVTAKLDLSKPGTVSGSHDLPVSAIFVNVLSIQSVDVQKTADGFIKTVQLQPHGQVTVTSDGTKLNIKALNCSSSAADSDDKKSVVYTITPGDAPQ